MSWNLNNHTSLVKALSPLPTGTGDAESAEIDRDTHEGILIFADFEVSDPGGGNSIELLQSVDDGQTWQELPSTRTAPSADGHVVLIDVYQPTGHAFKVKVKRATATAVGTVYVQLYASRSSGLLEDPADTGVDKRFVQSPEPVDPEPEAIEE